jgi:hypothetical protein
VSASYERTAIDDKTFMLAAQAQPGIGPEKLEAALLEQIEALRKAPPTDDELKRAKARIESSFVFAQDSVFYRGFLLGMYELAGGWRQVDDYLDLIAAVKPEDVLQAAQEHLGGETRSVASDPSRVPGRAVEALPGGPLGASPGERGSSAGVRNDTRCGRIRSARPGAATLLAIATAAVVPPRASARARSNADAPNRLRLVLSRQSAVRSSRYLSGGRRRARGPGTRARRNDNHPARGGNRQAHLREISLLVDSLGGSFGAGATGDWI